MSIAPTAYDIASLLARLQTLETTVVSLQETVEQLLSDNAALREMVAKQYALIRNNRRCCLAKIRAEPPRCRRRRPRLQPIPSADAPTDAPHGQSGQRHGTPGHGCRLYQ
jgi:tRNA(Ile)-lysidine synthase TilS/MesJ